jgi:hypothetical protein
LGGIDLKRVTALIGVAGLLEALATYAEGCCAFKSMPGRRPGGIWGGQGVDSAQIGVP